MKVVGVVLVVSILVALGERVEKEDIVFTCKGDSCSLDQDDEEPEWRFDTRAVHADDGIESNIADVAPPIHLTTTYRADNKEGLVYSRTDSPTRKRAEKVLGELEGPNNHAVLYASGLAATHALLAYLQPHRVALPKGYHGTRVYVYDV